MTIEGQRIVRLNTLGSMYDHGAIEAWDDEGKPYRIQVSEFLKILNDLNFEARKKRVHTYLTIQ